MGSAQEMLLLVELNTQIGISSKTAYVMSASVAVNCVISVNLMKSLVEVEKLLLKMVKLQLRWANLHFLRMTEIKISLL